MECRTDGLVSIPKGHVISTAMSTPQEVTDVIGSNSAPITFRGADYAGFDKPNNYTIGTWYGFSVAPTIGNSLGTGVERGKPVFYVNARTGITYALNGLYVGSSPVITAGQYGIGGVAVPLPLDTVLDDLKTKPTGKYGVNANGIGMPRAGVAYCLDWTFTSNANGGHGTLLASAMGGDYGRVRWSIPFPDGLGNGRSSSRFTNKSTFFNGRPFSLANNLAYRQHHRRRQRLPEKSITHRPSLQQPRENVRRILGWLYSVRAGCGEW